MLRSKFHFNGKKIAQIPPSQNQYLKNAEWKDAWGDRVKVRIPGIHPAGPEVKDDKLPWATVLKPTSSGNINGQSSGLWGGEWVVVEYIDGQLCVTGVLGKNISEYDIKESTNGSTYFKSVSRHNSGFEAPSHSQIGDLKKPTGPVQPTKEDFKKSTSDKLNYGQSLEKTHGASDGNATITGGNSISRAEIGRYKDAGYSPEQIAAIQAAVGDTPYSDQNTPGFRRTVSSTGEVNSSK